MLCDDCSNMHQAPLFTVDTASSMINYFRLQIQCNSYYHLVRALNGRTCLAFNQYYSTGLGLHLEEGVKAVLKSLREQHSFSGLTQNSMLPQNDAFVYPNSCYIIKLLSPNMFD